MIYHSDLEADLCEYCNLRCKQCSHASPFFTHSDPSYGLDQFTTDIGILSKKLHCEVFRVVGGEPLLNKRLAGYLEVIRAAKIADKVSLFTNGLLLTTADERIFSLIDQLRISIYPLPDNKLDQIQSGIDRVRKYSHLDIVANNLTFFSKSNLIEKNPNPAQVQSIFDSCYHKKNSSSIFNGRLYRCFVTRKKFKHLQAHKELVKGDISELASPDVDSIRVFPELSEYRLYQFLNTTTPLVTCSWCLGCSSKRVPITQLAPQELDYATLDDYDPSQGASQLSNCLLSWYRDKPKEFSTEKFISPQHLPEFTQFHSLSAYSNNR